MKGKGYGVFILSILSRFSGFLSVSIRVSSVAPILLRFHQAEDAGGSATPSSA